MNGPDARVTLITLGVADFARATAFYEALGFKRKARQAEGVAFFDAGGVVLSLWARESLVEDAGIDGAGSGFRGMALAWNVGSKEEVDKAMIRVATAGGKVVRLPQTVFWGGYTAYFADPDGHLWELAYNPSFPLDDRGCLVLPE